jgi:hypothetical protein
MYFSIPLSRMGIRFLVFGSPKTWMWDVVSHFAGRICGRRRAATRSWPTKPRTHQLYILDYSSCSISKFQYYSQIQTKILESKNHATTRPWRFGGHWHPAPPRVHYISRIHAIHKLRPIHLRLPPLYLSMALRSRNSSTGHNLQTGSRSAIRCRFGVGIERYSDKCDEILRFLEWAI